MAKRTYKILRFDGGINNDADPRDIGDNQFADLQNVAVDEMGKIIVLGDIQTERKALTALIRGEGNGLFACTTDHTGLLDDGLDNVGQTYYLAEHNDFISGIGSTDEATADAIACDFGNDGATMYYVDGALRIANATHADGGIVPVWRGYIPAKTYGPASTGADAAIAEQWATQNSEIAGAFPVFAFGGATYCSNAFIINEVDNTADANQAYDLNNGTASLAAYTDGHMDEAASGMRWGVGLEFDESANGTGTWMPTADIRYKFYITTMYDDHIQESLPQLMMMWPSTLLHSPANEYDNTTVQSEMAFTNGDAHDAEGENVAVWFAPAIKLNYDTGTAYNFGASAIDASSGGNPRISGVRIYWASNEDGFTTLWQIFDCKFDEGIKAIGVDGGGGGTSGYAPMIELNSDTFTMDISTDNRWTNPPRYFQYDVLNAHSATDVIKVDSYKTAIVANRRVYLGNIKQDGKIHGDRMLKSPVNQFDKFPSINNIDVAIHDGDDIVALVEYADRILQFKKNTCYIINVSGSAEYLEAEHKFKGITNPGAACRTDYGVAWANQNGCYMYDGQQVTDLLEDQGMRKINQYIWSIHIGTANYHRIGFNPFKRQLVVLQGTTGNDAYVYDMVTKSWTFSANMIVDGDSNSNFINDPVDGSLLMLDQGGNTIDKWADTPFSGAQTISIKTKDIDFGEPAIRKKLYRVRISYKGDASAVTIYIGYNGATPGYNFDSGSGGTATPLINAGTTDWEHVELKPSTISAANNIYSCQLAFGGSAATNFEINDITFIYRTKSIR
jgi:hypothetical protein